MKLTNQQVDTVCDAAVLTGLTVMIVALPFPGKAALKSWALLVPLAAYVFRMLYYRKFIIEKTPLDIPFVALFIIIFISCLTSIRPPYSIHEFQYEFLWHFVLFYLITSNLKRISHLKILFWTMIIMYSFVAIYGILGFFLGFGIHGGDGSISVRAKSMMHHPGEAAFFFALVIPFVMGVCMYERKPLLRTAQAVFVIVSVVFVVLTFSRGGWIGIGIALIYVLLKSRAKIFIMVLCACILMSPFIPDSVVQRLKTTTIGDRIFLWKSAICMIADYPLIGIGYGNRNYQQLYPHYSFYGIQEGNLQNAHNFYLQTLVEVGILGGLAFLGLFKSILYHLYTSMQHEQDPFRKGILLGGVGMMIAFLISSVTTFRYENDIALLFWIIVGILMAVHNTRESGTNGINGITCCTTIPGKHEN